MRILVVMLLFAASLLCYTMGFQSGFVILLLVGLVLEGTFWFKLSDLFKTTKPKS